jgi:hypothetical protein
VLFLSCKFYLMTDSVPETWRLHDRVIVGAVWEKVWLVGSLGRLGLCGWSGSVGVVVVCLLGI